MDTVKFGYNAPRELDRNLWEITGEWRNKFGRRMTVIRLQDGRLVIHNAFRLKQDDLEWLKSLGAPAFIVAPNKFHCSDAGWMAEKFPEAELFVPKSQIPAFQRSGFRPKDVNVDFPGEFGGELRCIPMQGTRFEEAAFIHIPSRTLILCDLSFNMGHVFSGLSKWIMEWNQVPGRFGPTRLTKLVFTKDQPSLIASYEALLKEDFDRVIVNHGDVLETGGKEKLNAGIQRIFGVKIAY